MDFITCSTTMYYTLFFFLNRAYFINVHPLKMCDFIGGPLILMHTRFLHFDFLNPYIVAPVMMLIPNPTLTFSNLQAVSKPFQQNVKWFWHITLCICITKYQTLIWLFLFITFINKVWLVLLILIPVTTIVLALLHSILKRFKSPSAPPVINESFIQLIKLYGDFVFKKIANQGKLQDIDNNFHFLSNFVLKRTNGDRNFTFPPSYYVGIMASYDGRRYQCLHWHSYLSNDGP